MPRRPAVGQRRRAAEGPGHDAPPRYGPVVAEAQRAGGRTEAGRPAGRPAPLAGQRAGPAEIAAAEAGGYGRGAWARGFLGGGLG
jgi:hypothetical protein